MDKKKRASKHPKAVHGRVSVITEISPLILKLISQDIALAVLIAWMFYDAVWMALPLFIPVVILNGKRFKQEHKLNETKRFTVEYKELLANLIAGLESGYSVENAFVEAENSHITLFGKESVILKDLHAINQAVGLRTPVEAAFEAFAAKYPYEEVRGFAQVFSFGKRLGGNYIENLRNTARKLEEKVELKQDIAATIAEKRLELSVMSVMPVLIIGYMRIGSGGFLGPMYHNLTGAVIMSVCIVVYVAAIILGRKVIDIEV